MMHYLSRLLFYALASARRVSGLKGADASFEPGEICIELTNRCNYSCVICPLKDSRIPKKDMDFGLFRKIVDDVADWNPDRASLTLHLFGEPFLYERIFDCMDYIEGKLRKCKVFFSTNFAAVDKEDIERLFKPKAYNLNIGVWLDTMSPETYSRQRGGGYQKVLENLDYLIELKRTLDSEKPEFHVGMILTEYNRGEADSFLRFWKKKLADVKGAEVRVIRSHDFSGQIPADKILSKAGGRFQYKNVCLMPFNMLVVYSNGDVGLCCHDVDHKILIGNVAKDGLRALWTGEKAKSFRQSMKDYRLDSFEPCKNCMYYNSSLSQAFKEAFYNRLYRMKARH